VDSDSLLNQQADVIETVLAHFRLPARVNGGMVAPRFIRFYISPAQGTRLKRVIALEDEIALALGSQDVRINRRGGQIEIQVPRDSFHGLSLLALRDKVKPIPPDTVMLGLDDEGHPLLVRLTSPDVAHALISGTTGSGKTALMRTIGFGIILESHPKDWGLVLIDPKGRGLRPLADAPHVIAQELGSPAEAAAGLLKWAVELMEKRDREEIDRPRIAVFIDEVADLMLAGGREVEIALARLSGRGREAGVHVIASTQKPNSQAVGSLARANFPLRLVGRVLSAEDSKVGAGLKGIGAERLLGRGDFIAVTGGKSVRFQAAYADPNELAASGRLRSPRT